MAAYLDQRNLNIPVWSAADVGADESKLGLTGSPTKVLKVDYVVLGMSGSQDISPEAEGISDLLQELVEDYIL